MKWLRTGFYVFFLLLMVTVQDTAAQRPDQLTFPPLELVFPSVAQQRTANGMIVYLKEDDELPLVDLTIMVRGGSIHDPLDKTGLSAWFAQSLETGGTALLTPAQLEEELDRMAARFSVTSSSYHFQIDLSVHQRDVTRAVELLADLLRRPGFDRERVELARQQLIEGVHRQNDRPAAIAGRYLARAINPGHPFGVEPTLDSLDNLKLTDLVALHQRFFQPQQTWWGVSGAINQDEILNLLAMYVGDWESRETDNRLLPNLPESLPPQITLVDRQLSQTTLLMGHRGISKDNPDLHAVRLANYLLGGGGFNSRLMREIRSNRGLAYSIYSLFQPGRYLPELFVVSGETRNDGAAEVVQLVREMIKQLIVSGVSHDELESAKNSMINSFIFAFEDSHAVVTQKMRLHFYAYPDDYLETYQERIRALSPADIQRVAHQYFHPDQMHIVLVGDSGILLADLQDKSMAIEQVEVD
ncbi:M16 family metallopeptidase [Pelovirga terrestris]|uniref:Insulinase family protein n=1 Tax=Pelovirga terrestris TaxID=2771352 RepID=A0A8J6UG73_9BACT|nr:pitrilysin family protein [Pelovirga terrestris]MBD1399223.1 insulinase family protein [Pelovirga terrestris]